MHSLNLIFCCDFSTIFHTSFGPFFFFFWGGRVCMLGTNFSCSFCSPLFYFLFIFLIFYSFFIHLRALLLALYCITKEEGGMMGGMMLLKVKSEN